MGCQTTSNLGAADGHQGGGQDMLIESVDSLFSHGLREYGKIRFGTPCPIHGGDMAEVHQFPYAVPMQQIFDRIGSDKPVERALWADFFSEMSDRMQGVTGGGSVQFIIAQVKGRIGCNGIPDHGESIPVARARQVAFQGRALGRDKDGAFGFKLVCSGPGDFGMASMNGIETSAKQYDRS